MLPWLTVWFNPALLASNNDRDQSPLKVTESALWAQSQMYISGTIAIQTAL
jgi:hypothetical protein